MSLIDPHAIIDPSARLATDVRVGPWSIIGAEMETGEGAVIGPHVVLKGPTKIGKHNRIYQFSGVGGDTSGLKYKSEPTRLVIGDHNVIHKGVAIHRGTVQNRAETTIGDHDLVMACAHIGHDSVVGNHCILVNNTALAGHVHVDDWAILSGYTLVHQYCRTGAHSFSGMGSAIGKDIPAYATVFGNPAEARNMNSGGMCRHGFNSGAIHTLRRAYKVVYRQGHTVEEALTELAESAAQSPEVAVFRDSIQSTTRGITHWAMADGLRVALVVGKASGDILRSGLMQALQARHPDIEFVGVGGPCMEAEGLPSCFPMERLSVVGLVEVLGRLPELLRRRKRLIRTLIEARPGVMIDIDVPDFTLGVGHKLCRAGLCTMHHVSPSVWAWRQKRVLKIREACDLMLALFPSEVRFYEGHGVSVRSVGHPLASTIPLQTNRAAVHARLGLPTNGQVMASMPSSRGGEIGKLGALFLDTARRLLVKWPGLRFMLPYANAIRRKQTEQMLQGREPLSLTLLGGASHEALTACDAMLITSGTTTLETLLYKRPMVVAYRVAGLTYQILKRLVKSPYISLPNLLAGHLLMPELIQDVATPQALAVALSPLLDDGSQQMKLFGAIHRALRQDASAQTAEAVLQLVGRR